MVGRVLRNLACFTALLALVVVVRDAGAVGGILSTPRDPAAVVEARFAIAVSKGATTRWASLRVERFPGAMAWLIPVRPGARIAETTDAWFEALDVATARNPAFSKTRALGTSHAFGRISILFPW